jgi:hypothetical protein
MKIQSMTSPNGNKVANQFIKTTKSSYNTDLYRIPREYDNVKDIVDLIISKAIKQ